VATQIPSAKPSKNRSTRTIPPALMTRSVLAMSRTASETQHPREALRSSKIFRFRAMRSSVDFAADDVKAVVERDESRLSAAKATGTLLVNRLLVYGHA
jgi:hypothetical protein